MTTAFSSLYVHFPFCESKCHYCDFYSLGREKTTSTQIFSFEAALKNEVLLLKPNITTPLSTVFLGGGTPSLTDPEVMEQILFTPLNLSQSSYPREWTMEANPSSVDQIKLSHYKSLGINRISFGVQALREDHLKLLGRVHGKKEVFLALESAFKAGFTNVSVDLLCGVPGQNIQDLKQAMDELTQFPITHLSCYLLTLSKHHPLYLHLPDENTQLNHLLFVDQHLTQLGFRHYEISNFCKPGFESQHNLAYWKGKSYLGLGPSAHSFDAQNQKRWKNFSSLHRYAEKLLKENTRPIEWEENLTPSQQQLESWLLAVRLEEGFPIHWLDTKEKQNKANHLVELGLLKTSFNHLSPTPKGFALSDQIIQTLS